MSTESEKKGIEASFKSMDLHNVDLYVLVVDGGVLGQDGDAALPLQIVGVHDALHRGLIFPVDAALLEHLVYQRGLAVVHVGNNGDVA